MSRAPPSLHSSCRSISAISDSSSDWDRQMVWCTASARRTSAGEASYSASIPDLTHFQPQVSGEGPEPYQTYVRVSRTWTVRQLPDGRWDADYTEPDPEPAPLTTI